MRRHQRAALRLAATIAGSDRAADAAQEGFLRAHRALPRFDPNRRFRPWILRIVANAAKNELRSSARHIRLFERAVAARVDLAPPTDPAVRSEDQRRLVDALTTLSVDDRLVIALRWFEEMGEAEMAEVLGVRRGTVKSRLHRAMSRLRSVLDHSDGDHE